MVEEIFLQSAGGEGYGDKIQAWHEPMPLQLCNGVLEGAIIRGAAAVSDIETNNIDGHPSLPCRASSTHHRPNMIHQYCGLATVTRCAWLARAPLAMLRRLR